MDLQIHRLTPDHMSFLREILYQAVFVPPGEPPPPRSIIDTPALARYIEGFGTRDGDVGLVAYVADKPIGATWVRLIEGYGFVDSQTPELSIAVLPDYRGSGAGTALLKALFDALRETFQRVSLSVQIDNPAAQLYQRLGFEVVKVDGSSYIMVKSLTGAD